MFNFGEFTDTFDSEYDMDPFTDGNTYYNYKLATCLLKYICDKLPPLNKEMSKWDDFKYSENNLDPLFTTALNKNTLMAQSYLFSELAFGMVSHQVKAIKLRFNEVQHILINENLDKAIKLKLVLDRVPRNTAIEKNNAYDPTYLPYKYYSNKTLTLNVYIKPQLLPAEILGLLRLYNIKTEVFLDD